MSIFKRIAGLFERYQAANDTYSGHPETIKGNAGQTLGAITEISVDSTHMRVSGHLMSDRVALHVNDQTSTAFRPRGQDARQPLRFDLSVAHQDNPHNGPRLSWDMNDAQASQTVRIPSSRSVALRRKLQFMADLVKVSPAIFSWLRTRNPTHRDRVKRGLGLHRNGAFQPINLQCVGQEQVATTDMPTGVTIILPVYNSLDLLKLCLERVIRNTDVPWHLIIVEDASSDEDVLPFLQTWAASDHHAARAAGKVTLLVNAENLGFVGAVNRGLKQAGVLHGVVVDAPIILLNSDALVPMNWASRLIGPMTGPEADPSVASVTPMSNDSEITTVPVMCAPHHLTDEHAVDRIDAVASTIPTAHATVDMPTGVGFCMAMAPRFLAELPELDRAFGRGYGEEVDWCQKARALGGRHIGTGALFVEHRGGSSFGSATKAKLIAENNQRIAKRYPAYDSDVAAFIMKDPLTTPRLMLALAWANEARDRLPVYLAHNMGGGADIWLQQQITKDLEAGLPSVVVRVGGIMRWQIEVHATLRDTGATHITGGTCDGVETVARLLGILSGRDFVYSCGVGHPDPASLPDQLLTWIGEDDDLEVLFHDWFPISPSYTLLDADGVYRGPVKSNRTDPAHVCHLGNGSRIPLDRWQLNWKRLLDRANLIRVFSPDGLVQLSSTWPDLNMAKVQVRGHQTDALKPLKTMATQRPAPSAPITIGVLGNLSLHKGIEVVDQVSRHLRKSSPSTQIIVLGQTDPAYSIHNKVKVHGGYDLTELPHLIAKYGITHWLMPSIWPETFSYAVHEALATGLPVFAFDLGAQGTAVHAAPTGTPIPLKPTDNPAQNVLDVLLKS